MKVFSTGQTVYVLGVMINGTRHEAYMATYFRRHRDKHVVVLETKDFAFSDERLITLEEYKELLKKKKNETKS